MVNHHKSVKKTIGLGIMCLCVTSCGVGNSHTSDWQLMDTFMRHETDFQALATELSADEKVEMLRVNEVRYAHRTFSIRDGFSELEHLGLTRERLVGFNRQLQRLGVMQVTQGRGEIEFRVDGNSMWNGASCKGYRYALTPPSGRRMTNLDQYRISEKDRDENGNYVVYRPIKGNWYLYLFVFS